MIEMTLEMAEKAVKAAQVSVIGTIGCGGGTGEEDHQCALAGVAAVGG